VYWDGMYFDVEVRGTFVKSRMSTRRDNPEGNIVSPNDAVKLDTNTDISGSVMPFVARAQSRYVLHAMMMDSVPPLVIVPAPDGQLCIRRHMLTISASIFRTAGNTSGCKGFETQYF
jgi:hypothetical protein